MLLFVAIRRALPEQLAGDYAFSARVSAPF
jgi:hypothetical protein